MVVRVQCPFPSPFPIWQTLIYPSNPSSNVPSLESLSWHPSSGSPGTSACIPGPEGVAVDNVSSLKGMEQKVFPQPCAFPSTKCPRALILVSLGALQGPEALDFSFPGAAKLYHFTSADALYLPGILPTAILAWCPLRERNSCLLSLQCGPGPGMNSSYTAAHLILCTSL